MSFSDVWPKVAISLIVSLLIYLAKWIHKRMLIAFDLRDGTKVERTALEAAHFLHSSSSPMSLDDKLSIVEASHSMHARDKFAIDIFTYGKTDRLVFPGLFLFLSFAVIALGVGLAFHYEYWWYLVISLMSYPPLVMVNVSANAHFDARVKAAKKNKDLLDVDSSLISKEYGVWRAFILNITRDDYQVFKVNEKESAHQALESDKQTLNSMIQDLENRRIHYEYRDENSDQAKKDDG